MTSPSLPATWPPERPRPGLWPDDEGTFTICVYAPRTRQVELVVEGRGRPLRLAAVADGYHVLAKADLQEGDRYRVSLDGADPLPDPASLAQPEGVHAASEVVDLRQNPPPHWQGREMRDMIIYELHVGTFSEGGTLDSAIPHLSALVELGVNTVELMPLNSFAGERNWGYDGVYWQAVQRSYGGPAALRRFVDAAHERGLAVLVDVVFNHLGPEGNYLGAYAPYLSELKRTPWGPALNTDGPASDGVRDFVLSVAHTWLVDYGADGLRLDAVHAIPDSAALHILEELSVATAAWSETLNRPLTLIAECDLNDPRYVRPVTAGGLGMSGQWVDEFHHALRSLLTGDRRAYYADFGSFADVVAALHTGYVYTGQYSPHRERRFGRLPAGVASHQFVVFGQNHDQVGNRALGERLHEHLSEDDYLLTAAAVLWSPFTPMLWMGEEYREERPFPFFVDHQDQQILQATREGRAREFAGFLTAGEAVPDPGAEATFLGAKLQHRREGRVYDFYREALRIRNLYWPARLRDLSDTAVRTFEVGVVAWCMPRTDGSNLWVVANFGTEAWSIAPEIQGTSDRPSQRLASTSTSEAAASLPPRSAAVWLTAAPRA